MKKIILILPLLLFLLNQSFGQQMEGANFLAAPDSLSKPRLLLAAGGGAAIYTGASIVLWNTWYKQYETTSFHFFNDWHEWEGLDKGGHLLTAYHEAKWTFDGACWTGMDRRKAMWTGVGVGFGLQATIEMMDAFAAKWGFSVGDIGFNSLGVSLFAAQELLWQQQRITPKVSFSKQDYPADIIYSLDGSSSTTLEARAQDLYGTTFITRFFKDYNGHTFWLSVNPRSFSNNPDSWFPKWLNLAVGYGGQNMYGGFENSWPAEAPVYFVDNELYPRYSQFYFSFDVDLTKIPTRKRFLKAILGAANFIKIPAPAIEINTLGKVKFYPLYW
ncbi:MAG: DUF2279 domain-containing protein [Saprospiraceae bacterium]|nr:DUF2279 domain-containing protein [Saprospiraceae bacterium]